MKKALLFRVLFFLLLAINLVTAVVRGIVGRSDLEVFVRGSERMLSGQYVTISEIHHFTYPPIFAFVMIPFSWPSLPVARVLWALFCFVLLLLIVHKIVTLIGEEVDHRYAVGALSLLICLQVTLAVFQNQQFDLLVFFLALFGIAQLLDDRPTLGGVLLGAAAAIKCTPLLFLPYLLIKRHFKAAGAMVLTGILLSFLPDLVFLRPGTGELYLFDWFAKIIYYHPVLTPFIDPAHAGSIAPGGGTNELNQALGILIVRLFSEQSDSPIHLFDLSKSTVTVLKIVAYLILLVPIIWAGTWRRSFFASSRAVLLAEMSLIFPLMLLYSPMSSKAHFVALLLPCAILVHHILLNPSRRGYASIALLFVFGVLTGRDLLGATASVAYHAGVITWVTIAIYLAVVIHSRRLDLGLPKDNDTAKADSTRTQ